MDSLKPTFNRPSLPASQNRPIMTEDPDGTRSWKLNGQYHRKDGPAIEFEGGKKGCAYYWHGKMHRKGGPAFVQKRCGQVVSAVWMRHGKQHREDGPAVEGKSYKEWYLNGKKLTEEQFAEAIEKKSARVQKAAARKEEQLTRACSPALSKDMPVPKPLKLG